MRKRTGLGLSILAIFFVLGWVGPVLFDLPSPFEQNLEKEYSGSEAGHLFGYAENGVDVLSHILWSAKNSILLAVSSVCSAFILGLFLGGVAAWFGGLSDFLVLRIIEIFESFPGLLLVVALASFWGPDPGHVFVVLILNSWIGFAKLARLLVLRLKNQDFVIAAQATGQKTFLIFLKYLIPAMSAELGVLAAQSMGSALLIESSLSFLGLGYPPGTPSWGAMLNQAREVMITAPHVIFYPAMSIFLCVFSFQLIGDGIRLQNNSSDS